MKIIAAYLQHMGASIFRQEIDLCLSSTHGFWAWHFLGQYLVQSVAMTSRTNRDDESQKTMICLILLLYYQAG